MPEEVLLKSETVQSREDVATYLRSVADRLESGESMTLEAGQDSVTLDPPARPTFEVKVEREGPQSGPGEMSVEFELEWNEQVEGADEGPSIS